MLTRHGESLPNAQKMSRDFVVEVSRQLNGDKMYFGKSTVQARVMAVQDDYRNGETIEQLRVKYSFSTRHIYNIIKKTSPSKARTTGAPAIAIIATRMMMKAGVDQDDAVNAARGLLAVVAARLGGASLYIPAPRNAEGIIKQIEIVRYSQAGKSLESLVTHFGLSVEEIRDILKNHPAATMPDSRELPKIKTRLFNMAASFSGYAEINTLLESATNSITRAEKIISNLKGG